MRVYHEPIDIEAVLDTTLIILVHVFAQEKITAQTWQT